MPREVGGGPAHRPTRDDWLTDIPARFTDGRNGFDLRLAQDLGRVGVKAWSLTPLANRPVSESLPEAIPVFVDWLAHIDERVADGGTIQDRLHKRAIWGDLIRCLYDPAAKRNSAVIDVLIDQFENPNFPVELHHNATQTLDYVAGARDFDRIVKLMDRVSDHHYARLFLVRYIGRVTTRRAHELLRQFVRDDDVLRWESIRWLPKHRDPDDIALIAAFRGTSDADGDEIIDKALVKLRTVTAAE